MKIKLIPPAGFEGVALREAAATEFRQVCDLVRAALVLKLGRDSYIDMESMYPDRVIVRESGRFYAYPYTLGADNVVTLGDKVEVVEKFVSVKEAVDPAAVAQIVNAARDGDTVFLEAVADVPGKFLIRVIRAGASVNGNYYPDAVLREAVGLFEGARVFDKSDADHIKGGNAGKSVANLMGATLNARFVEGKKPDTGEIHADLMMIEPEGAISVKLREACQRNMTKLFGFSIDADGTAEKALVMREGRKVRLAKRITKVHSVDLIVEPSAGGELIRLIEAVTTDPQEKDDMTLRLRMIEAIKAKKPDFDGANATDDEIETAYREAVSHRPVAADPQGAEALKSVRLVEARITARDVVSKAKLPQAAKDKVLARFVEATEPFTATDVDKAIEDERAYLAKFVESGKPTLQFGDGVVEDRSLKIGEMLDAFFDPKHKDHGRVQSFKECYIEITGDRRVSGRIEHCDRTRLAEAVGASFQEAVTTGGFTNVLGNSLRRAMIAAYNTGNEYDVYRPLITTVPLADFRTNDRVRFGGYGDIPTVNEAGSYDPLTTPADEKAQYAATKRGGTESITLESIKNDDVGFIRQIPMKMGRAAKRTLAKFVLDFLRSNPTIYDGNALFHASHNNLFTTAFSAAEFAVHRLAMKKQAELTSADRLGIGPKFLLGPADLEEAMRNAFVRNTNNDPTFVQSLNPTILPVWYWTDVTDWCTAADPADIPGIEIGFLDGQEEPEMFVQDMPNVGSLFTNDKVTYKLRHVYGGCVQDFRGFTKAVVAG